MRTSLVPATMVVLLWAASSEAVAAQDERPRIDIRIEQADLSFEELQRLVPALERIDLPEEFHVERLRASGPLTALTVDFLIRSRDSDMSGRVTGNLAGPARTVSGSVTISGMNLARLDGRSALPSHLTATSTIENRMPISVTASRMRS